MIGKVKFLAIAGNLATSSSIARSAAPDLGLRLTRDTVLATENQVVLVPWRQFYQDTSMPIPTYRGGRQTTMAGLIDKLAVTLPDALNKYVSLRAPFQRRCADILALIDHPGSSNYRTEDI